MKKETDDVTFIVRSGNVFEQLGLPNPAERQHKAQLMFVINEAIKRQSLTQIEAAKKVGLGQGDISRISHGRGSRYSIERLMNVIDRLGIDVEVVQRRDEDGDLIIEARELIRGPVAPVTL